MLIFPYASTRCILSGFPIRTVLIMLNLLNIYRSLRIRAKQLTGKEPVVKVRSSVRLEFHGHADYGGWAIPKDIVGKDSVIVDVGLGEDISFSESLIEKHGCMVHGFDPTPKSIKYVKSRSPRNFLLNEQGIAGRTRKAKFYLPKKRSHVSGSITKAEHVGAEEIEVDLISLSDMIAQIGAKKITILKIDIEGAEYELLTSEDFIKCAPDIDVICIEFHHRWKEFGKGSTEAAVAILEKTGFQCVWRSRTTNEEFTFARANG